MLVCRIVHTQIERESAVLRHVGENVRAARARAAMSQAALAEASGLSRRTVINLEAGEANVSLSAVDRLAEALGTTFSRLVAEPSSPSSRIDEVMWRGAGPASIAVLCGAAPATVEAQLWTWALEPGDRYDAEPDPAGWQEMVLVTGGRLIIRRADHDIALEAGGHATYPTDTSYSYVNDGDGVAEFVRLVIS